MPDNAKPRPRNLSITVIHDLRKLPFSKLLCPTGRGTHRHRISLCTGIRQYPRLSTASGWFTSRWTSPCRRHGTLLGESVLQRGYESLWAKQRTIGARICMLGRCNRGRCFICCPAICGPKGYGSGSDHFSAFNHVPPPTTCESHRGTLISFPSYPPHTGRCNGGVYANLNLHQKTQLEAPVGATALLSAREDFENTPACRKSSKMPVSNAPP